MKKTEELKGEQLKPQKIEKNSHPLDADSFPHHYFSERSEKYIIRNTIQNLEHFLKYHGIKTRLNEMNYRIEVTMNERIEYSAKNIDHFVVIKSLLAEAGYDKILNVNDYATQIAIKNMYHPTRDWILSKPLTTTGNIKRMVAALNTKNPEITEVLLTTWLISGIKAWFHKDGVSAQGVLILCGKTGTRKTTFVKGLLPSAMLLEGHVLNTNKDGNKITALAYAITEMGEIGASIRASSDDGLKGFFTTEVDSIRVPYGRVDTIRERRTIFTGTVNEARFLTDETGNRRYWVIDIDDQIDTDHGVDPQQLWAEAKQLYDNGAKWYLTPEYEAKVSEINKHHDVENEMQELLLARYRWDKPRTRCLNCSEIVIDLGLQLGNKRIESELRKALRKLEKEAPHIIKIHTKKGNAYELPELNEAIRAMQAI